MSVVTRIGGVEQGGLNDEAAREQALMRRQQFTVLAGNTAVLAIGCTAATVGSITGVAGTSGLPLLTRSTSAASVGATALLRQTSNPSWSWRDRPRVHFRFRAPGAGAAGERVFVGISSSSTPAADTTDALQMIALRCSGNASDATWKIVTSNGSASTVTDTGVAVGTNLIDATVDYTVSGVAVIRTWELVAGVWTFRAETRVTATLPAMTLDGNTNATSILSVESLDGAARTIDLGRIHGSFGSYQT